MMHSTYGIVVVVVLLMAVALLVIIVVLKVVVVVAPDGNMNFLIRLPSSSYAYSIAVSPSSVTAVSRLRESYSQETANGCDATAQSSAIPRQNRTPRQDV